jgi:hypothetical protein
MGAGASAKPFIEKARFAYKSGVNEITLFQLRHDGVVVMTRWDSVTRQVKRLEGDLDETHLNVSTAHYAWAKDVQSGRARLYVSDVETRTRDALLDPNGRKVGRRFVESIDHVTLISKVFSRWDRMVSHREGSKENNPLSRVEPCIGERASGVSSSFPSIESVTFGGIKGKCRPSATRNAGRLTATQCGGAKPPTGRAKVEALAEMAKRQLAMAQAAEERGDSVTFDRFCKLAADTSNRVQHELDKLASKQAALTSKQAATG